MPMVVQSLPSVQSGGGDPPTGGGALVPPNTSSSSSLPQPDPVPSSGSLPQPDLAPSSGKHKDPFEKGLDGLIKEGEKDLREGHDMLDSSSDEDMDDGDRGKKRDRSNETGSTAAGESDPLLAPFPYVPNPAEFARIQMGEEMHNRIMLVPVEEQQDWLLSTLKEYLIRLPKDKQQYILSLPKEQRFFAMKQLYRK